MFSTVKNTIEFKVYGKYALFTDPVTRIGGEKCSYHVPTYEALKGIAKSIYWKPTFVWVIDEVRVMKKIQTQTKGVKPLKYNEGGNFLSIYTFLYDVEYQVKAHFEWNEFRTDLISDRNDGKHFEIAKRSLEKGGRQDIFLGTRDCQGYVEESVFGEGVSEYDNIDELAFGFMFHSFGYPGEIGGEEFYSYFNYPVMKKSIIKFERPENCTAKYLGKMDSKIFEVGLNLLNVDKEFATLED